MKTLVYATLGSAALFVGVLGLVIPILPGFLFLLIAAAAFAAISPTLRNRLRRNPRFARYFNHLDAGAQLDLFSRCKLAFWASLDALNPRHRSTK